MHECTTVLELLTWLMENWGTILIRIRKDGKYQVLPLAAVDDQGKILKVVMEILTTWKGLNEERNDEEMPKLRSDVS